jgi:hypothetical protein
VYNNQIPIFLNFESGIYPKDPLDLDLELEFGIYLEFGFCNLEFSEVGQ